MKPKYLTPVAADHKDNQSGFMALASIFPPDRQTNSSCVQLQCDFMSEGTLTPSDLHPVLAVLTVAYPSSDHPSLCVGSVTERRCHVGSSARGSGLGCLLLLIQDFSFFFFCCSHVPAEESRCKKKRRIMAGKWEQKKKNTGSLQSRGFCFVFDKVSQSR